MESLFQNAKMYGDSDHETWKVLSKRHMALAPGKLSSVYQKGFELLGIQEDQIPDLSEISSRLNSITGWQLIPVSGLIPTRDFFYLLINRQYPVTVTIRKPFELDFSEQPDIFHDVCGHLPLLANESFVRYLSAFSIIGLRYVNNERAVDLLGRLYWYTYEMGIIIENGEYKPYGGAIITSSREISNSLDDAVSKHPFSIDKIFSTPYNPYKLQSEYFVIESFQELFDSLEHLEAKLIEHLVLPYNDDIIHNFPINANLGIKFNNVIGFLNDTQHLHPNAISFVAGQPDESLFGVSDSINKFHRYVDHVNSGSDGPSARKTTSNRIAQYGKTKGMINDVLSKYLMNDENINVKPDEILVTIGAQEAFSIIVSTICDREKDVILVEDPSYIGLSSFAKVFDFGVEGVKSDSEGLNLPALRTKLIELRVAGRNMKLLYVIPDYQNPSGSTMPIGNRLKLLEMAQQYNFLIIEDSVYNSFTYLEKRVPTLKSLDKHNRVIYVGSFSKLLYPGLRIGMIVSNQRIEKENGDVALLIDEMVKVKAQITNNTSTICQAIVAGVLIDEGFTLRSLNAKKYECYKEKRDQIVWSLNAHIGKYRDSWAADLSWNEPEGGFFIKMCVPFELDVANVLECAEQFNVLFCPMRFFYLKGGGEREIRLTFSNLNLSQIDEGIRRLAQYIQKKVKEHLPASADRKAGIKAPSLHEG